MYGLGTDDSHNYHQFGGAFSNAGRGWVMVHAEALTPKSLIEAMEAGDFYASTGVILESVEGAANRLHVKVRPEPGVTFTIEFIGVNRNEARSRILKKTNGTEGSFNLKADQMFVRARVTSSKTKANPYQEGDHEMAWTQPVVYR